MNCENPFELDKFPVYDFTSLLQDGDVLLIFPPFSSWRYPSLACHLLQACAGEIGIRVSVLYANIIFAEMIGKESYDLINVDYHQLLGERLFSRAAYNLPPFGSFQYNYCPQQSSNDSEYVLNWPEIQLIETKTTAWIKSISKPKSFYQKAIPIKH